MRKLLNRRSIAIAGLAVLAVALLLFSRGGDSTSASHGTSPFAPDATVDTNPPVPFDLDYSNSISVSAAGAPATVTQFYGTGVFDPTGSFGKPQPGGQFAASAVTFTPADWTVVPGASILLRHCVAPTAGPPPCAGGDGHDDVHPDGATVGVLGAITTLGFVNGPGLATIPLAPPLLPLLRDGTVDNSIANQIVVAKNFENIVIDIGGGAGEVTGTLPAGGLGGLETDDKIPLVSDPGFGASGNIRLRPPGGPIAGEIISYTSKGTTVAACSPVSSPCLIGTTGATRGAFITKGEITSYAAGTDVLEQLADGVTDALNFYPDVAAAGVPGATPIQRSYTQLVPFPGTTTNVVANLTTFAPGALASFGFPTALGYPTIFAVENFSPLLPPDPSLITDQVGLDVTVIHPSALRVNPTTAGTKIFFAIAQSRRDADNDGFDNDMDRCPLFPDVAFPFSALVPPLAPLVSQLTLDSDIDGIPDSCDLDKAVPAAPDVDGDDFANAQDNCPEFFLPPATDSVNPLQVESEPLPLGLPVPGGPADDAIGDICDLNPTVPDGHFHEVLAKSYVCITDATHVDTDGDGWCDVDEGTHGSTVGVSAAAGESGLDCFNNKDDDKDGFINDGCPGQATAESGTDCLNGFDDDGDAFTLPPIPTSAEVFFLDSNPDTIVRTVADQTAGGSWLINGFLAGRSVIVSGSTSNNSTFLIASSTSGTLTLDGAATLALEGPVTATFSLPLGDIIGLLGDVNDGCPGVSIPEDISVISTCDNGKDDDGDGAIDLADSGCQLADHDLELVRVVGARSVCTASNTTGIGSYTILLRNNTGAAETAEIGINIEPRVGTSGSGAEVTSVTGATVTSSNAVSVDGEPDLEWETKATVDVSATGVTTVQFKVTYPACDGPGPIVPVSDDYTISVDLCHGDDIPPLALFGATSPATCGGTADSGQDRVSTTNDGPLDILVNDKSK